MLQLDKYVLNIIGQFHSISFPFFVVAFQLRKNERLPYYHQGAYGHTEKNHWSCCNKEGREAEGCVESTRPTPSMERKSDPLKRSRLPSRESATMLRSKSLPRYYEFSEDSIGSPIVR